MIDMNTEHHVNEASNGEAKWQDAYNDDPELANSPVLEKFKTDRDALKGLVNLESYKGRSIAMLGEDATAEEKSALVEKLRNNGMDVTFKPNPEDPDDVARFWQEQGVPSDGVYTLPEDTVLEGLPQEGVDAAIELSKKMGHTAKQHETFVNALNEYNVELNSTNEQARVESDDKFTKILGDSRPALEGILADAVAKHQHPDMPAEPFTPAQKLVMVNLMKSVSVDPQSFDQINNPNTGPTPAELRARQNELWQQLTKEGGRNLTKQQKKAKQAEYEKTFADLAKFK